MREGWKTVCLGDVCTFKPPKKEARQRLNPGDVVSFVPMNNLGVRKKALELGEERPLEKVAGSYTYFADGDVLLAKITPCFENGKLGIASGLRNGVGFGSSEFIVMRPSEELDAEYLFYFLSQDSVRNAGARVMSGAVGHKRVPKEFIEQLKLALPVRSEQKRIVVMLDEAFEGIDTVVANTQKNLINAQELFESSVVHRVFGDPDAKGWGSSTVEKIALTRKGSIRTGPFGSQLLHSEFVDEGIAVLGIDNAVNNEFAWGKNRFINEDKYEAMKRYTVNPGDVIITIMGTCGRCAIVPDDIPTAINTKHLCCITLDQNRCLPGFLHSYFLYHPVARDYLEKHAKGSIMAGLNMGIIKSLPVRLPDLDEQSRIVVEIDNLRNEAQHLEAIYQQKLTALAELKQSLLHKAFSGELTARSAEAAVEEATA